VDTTITVRCACGWETSGSEDDVIEATVEHGRRLHNMIATREEVLSRAVPAVTPGEPATEPSRPSPR
jgi:predicted small metal-binding protein